ncbi:GFA family protein [Parasphingorhabdus halotolerans]|uniref:GFA family protein n=2 Tax=Parasphingorhabdus halotolerans TaxID=2725558 RepID=A0A6H2DPP9_9SPHN|nr:GFA family protein [Parasphingorhabdus halotolerans]
MKVTGSCHCSAVHFEASIEPKPGLLDCNCSICSRTGFLHLIVPHERFTLLSSEDALTSYKFGSGQADHLFCKHCGVKCFYQPRSHPDAWSVNYNCLDTGHGLEPVIVAFDGQNWEEAKAGLE